MPWLEVPSTQLVLKVKFHSAARSPWVRQRPAVVGAPCQGRRLALLLLLSPEPLGTTALMCPTDCVARCLLPLGELSSAPSPSPCPSWCSEMVVSEMGFWFLSSALANRACPQASFYLFEVCKVRPPYRGCCWGRGAREQLSGCRAASQGQPHPSVVAGAPRSSLSPLRAWGQGSACSPDPLSVSESEADSNSSCPAAFQCALWHSGMTRDGGFGSLVRAKKLCPLLGPYPMAACPTVGWCQWWEPLYKCREAVGRW